MTIQLAIANSYGLAMASDRHIFRDGPGRSTGQECKLLPFSGSVPGAMMAAGPLAVLDVPVSRFALRVEAAAVAASRSGRPEMLGEAVLDALGEPLARGPSSPAAGSEADTAILSEKVEEIVDRAVCSGGDSRQGLQDVLLDINRAPGCRDEARVRSVGEAAWAASAPHLPGMARKPHVAAALREAPDLVGTVVVAALTRDWRDNSEIYVTVGLCCPATGVPVMAAVRLWRGVGDRLVVSSRLTGDYEAVWKANRTVVMAQGSGRAIIEAMVDGVAEEHWTRLSAAARTKLGPGMSARWDGAHERIAVSSLRELGALAAGLVRGAEAIGYLTRRSEGTVAPVDCLLVTPQGVIGSGLEAGAEPGPWTARPA